MKKLTRKNLLNTRKEAGFSKSNIAKLLGITERQYQRLEAGTSEGSVKVWEKLKRVLNAPSIDFLLEQEEPLNHDTTRKVM